MDVVDSGLFYALFLGDNWHNTALFWHSLTFYIIWHSLVYFCIAWCSCVFCVYMFVHWHSSVFLGVLGVAK